MKSYWKKIFSIIFFIAILISFYFVVKKNESVNNEIAKGWHCLSFFYEAQPQYKDYKSDVSCWQGINKKNCTCRIGLIKEKTKGWETDRAYKKPETIYKWVFYEHFYLK